MNWAHYAIIDLQSGNSHTIFPRGNSMQGKVESGDKVVLQPAPEFPQVDDIVLVKVKGNVYLHLIKAIKSKKDKLLYQIGNNKGGINGWVSRDAIYGIATEIADVQVVRKTNE